MVWMLQDRLGDKRLKDNAHGQASSLEHPSGSALIEAQPDRIVPLSRSTRRSRRCGSAVAMAAWCGAALDRDRIFLNRKARITMRTVARCWG